MVSSAGNAPLEMCVCVGQNRQSVCPARAAGAALSATAALLRQYWPAVAVSVDSCRACSIL